MVSTIVVTYSRGTLMTEEHRAGKPLSMSDLEMITDAIKKRRENFPEEPKEMTWALVLMNIGDRFTPVECMNGEWRGVKKDVPKGEDEPKCPNGHVLIQGKGGLTIGWVKAE